MKQLSRRDFLQASTVTALTIAIPLPLVAKTKSATANIDKVNNAYLKITADNTITAILPTAEMGQGTHTGQLMILAEELGVKPETIQVEMPL